MEIGLIEPILASHEERIKTIEKLLNDIEEEQTNNEKNENQEIRDKKNEKKKIERRTKPE